MEIRKQKDITSSIIIYLIIMLMAMCIYTSLDLSVAILWIGNLIGFAFTLLRYSIRLSGKSIFVLIASFVLISSISTIINIDWITDDIKTLGIHVNIAIIVFYMCLYSSFRSGLYTIEIEKLLKAISYMGLFTAIYAWIYDFNGYVAIFQGASVYSQHIEGFFNNKNAYGCFISLSLLADLYIYRKKKNYRPLFNAAIKFVAVVVSFSRAALLFLLVVISVYWLFCSKNKLRNFSIIFGMIVFALFVIQVYEPAYEFLINKVVRPEVGDAGRTIIRNRAWEIFLRYDYAFLIGIGYAGLSELSLDLDNTYMYELFTGGFAKCLIISILYIINLCMLVKEMKKEYNKLALSCAIGYLVYMIFESMAPLELGINTFMFFLLIFILPSCRTMCRSKV